jgi:hypothetical protein
MKAHMLVMGLVSETVAMRAPESVESSGVAMVGAGAGPTGQEEEFPTVMVKATS